MNLILKNPYRNIGVLVGATAREKDKQIRRLKQFLDAEQEPEDDFSFPVLGVLNRTIEIVDDAAAKINLDSDKIESALFWFYNGNDITDEPAFDAIKSNDVMQAFNIWEKLIASKEITKKNASAYSNLSNLLLSGIFEGTNLPIVLLENAITYKIKFLESIYVKDFKSLATDETFKTTNKELQLIFLNKLFAEIDENKLFSMNDFLNILSDIEFKAKDDFLNNIINSPIAKIENLIENSRINRKTDKSKSIIIGKNLYSKTAEYFEILKSVLDNTNIKYSSISDKVSDEILQCGISYFQHYKDSNTDPSIASLDMFRKAKSLAIGKIAKQRTQENTENLQEWKKQKLIGVDIEFITSKLERFQNLSDTVGNAKEFIVSCKPKLLNIKTTLGAFDEFYLTISSAVVSNAQGMLITAVNNAQERTSLNTLNELSTIINNAFDVTTFMQTMDMNANLKQSFQKNRGALSNIRNQINVANNKSNSGSGGSSGCYIATMAYGNYNHPQVLILREFRDNVLTKSQLGVWFIKTYYYYSPKLVEKMKNKKVLNIIIRKGLNQIIKIIKK